MRYFKHLVKQLIQPNPVPTPLLYKVVLLSVAFSGYGLAQPNEEWFTRSQSILNRMEGQSRQARLNGNSQQDEAKQQAMEIINDSKSIALGERSSAANSTNNGKPLRVMFVSFSLGESLLKDIFQEASGQNDVLLVLRGPKPHQKLPNLFADLKKLLKEIEPVPNIVIDPTRFQKYAVTTVPEIVLEDQGKASLRVKGVTSLDWFKSRQFAGKLGDLGRFGEIYEIAEMDMLDEIKTRIAAIDWRQKKQQALARFWEKRQFEVLPIAQQDSDRLIDLTVTAPRDLVAPNGKLIIPAGLTVNPLDKMPFGLCLLVFDATEKSQVDRVLQLSCQDKKARVMYLVTQLPRQDGWESLKALETLLNTPVYLLTTDVRQRFKLEMVPALVEQSGNKLIVRERKVLSSSAGAAS